MYLQLIFFSYCVEKQLKNVENEKSKCAVEECLLNFQARFRAAYSSSQS